jgi:RNA polymerase sigma factor (sigma-70 family)
VLQEQFLLAKLKARDPHAWKKVIKDLSPLAISISRSILQSHTDAEDITQQALIALSAPYAIEKAKIKNLDQLKNFFAAIVRNKSKDHLRKKTAQRRGQGKVWNFSELQTEDSKSPQPYDRPAEENVLSSVDYNEKLDLIRDLLLKLPEKQQQILEGFYLRGLTYAEISETYDIPLGSIGVYLNRAVSKIRSLVSKQSANNLSKISVICTDSLTTQMAP